MLVSKLPFLCQRCHVTSRHPPTVYDGFVLQNSSNANKNLHAGMHHLPPDGAWIEFAIRQGLAALRKEECDARQMHSADRGAPADRLSGDGASASSPTTAGAGYGVAIPRQRPTSVASLPPPMATKPATSGIVTSATVCSRT
jgi:hypothetical protein